MAKHENCSNHSPHRPHTLVLAHYMFDVRERCSGIPTAEELLAHERGETLRLAKASLAAKKAALLHQRKLDKIQARIASCELRSLLAQKSSD